MLEESIYCYREDYYFGKIHIGDHEILYCLVVCMEIRMKDIREAKDSILLFSEDYVADNIV